MMDEWKDTNNKFNDSEHEKNNLILSLRQLGFVVAGNIILLFMSFIFGYFWGQKYAVEQFVDKIHNESFADKISSSLLSLQQNTSVREIAESIFQENENQLACDNESNEYDVMQSESDTINNSSATSYYAQLIGFGTLNAANQFVNRLQKKNISLEIKKRTSKTTRGKKITWYQVVTKKYTDRFVLDKLVETLKKDEKLKDPCIIVC